MDLKAIETRIGDAVHSVLANVEKAEPEIEQGAEAALLAAGAPATVAAAAGSLMTELLNHFRGQAHMATTVTGAGPGDETTSASLSGSTALQPGPVQPVAASQLSS